MQAHQRNDDEGPHDQQHHADRVDEDRENAAGQIPVAPDREQRQDDDQQRAADHLGVVAGLETGEEEPPQPHVGGVGGERRRGDDLEGGRSQSLEQQRNGGRQLHLGEHLPRGQADGASRIHRDRFGRGDTRVGTCEHRGNGQHQ